MPIGSQTFLISLIFVLAVAATTYFTRSDVGFKSGAMVANYCLTDPSWIEVFFCGINYLGQLFELNLMDSYDHAFLFRLLLDTFILWCASYVQLLDLNLMIFCGCAVEVSNTGVREQIFISIRTKLCVMFPISIRFDLFSALTWGFWASMAREHFTSIRLQI